MAGAYVDSNNLHRHLPPKITKRVKRRTLITLLAAKGYKPERKISKNDPGAALMKNRLEFARSVLLGMLLIGKAIFRQLVILKTSPGTPES